MLDEHDIELLTSKALAHFATVMPDGSPHVSPVWIDYEDGMVLVNTAEGRAKWRNVKRDPRVALSVANVDDPYDMTSIQGRVVEMTHEGANEHIDKLSERYRGKTPYGKYVPRRVLLKIRPERISRMRD
jgi:PPOX class probable F420-dependent enzyme